MESENVSNKNIARKAACKEKLERFPLKIGLKPEV
jgi:hypothetical protein